MATATRDKQGRFKSETKTGNGDSTRNIGVLAGTAAAGAAIGVLAMLGRKAAIQATTAFAGNWDEALAAEHSAVRKVFDALEATDENAKMKRNLLLANLKHALTKHAIEEENVIYPALHEAGRAAEADHLYAEHAQVKQYLYELENMPSSSPEWIATVRKFRSDIEKHMTEEESTLFPSLRKQLSEEKNKQLTMAMNKEGFKVA